MSPKGGRAGGKRPASRVTGAAVKRPATARDRDGDNRLSWRIALMDLDGPWPWTMTPAKVLQVRSKIAEFERQTWAELSQQHVPRLKRIALDSLCTAAQNRLVHLKKDDVDGLWELRLAGQERVWGLRQADIFYLLWWDPDHQVCPSHLRHT